MADQPASRPATPAALNEQADAVRAELARLRQDLAQVQRDFSDLRAVQLLEANEQLVVAALRAEAIAETAVSNLGDVTRSAQRDALTDTPNRTLMLDRLEGAIAMARRRGTHAAVLFLDLDDFKQINDSLGHAAGDAVLQLVARRLEAVVRESDTVSRHSGDEFLVLLAEVAQPSDAVLTASKLLAALAEPCQVSDRVLQLSASVGIALYPEDGEDAATLIGRADTAMYRIKREGRNSGFEAGQPLQLAARHEAVLASYGSQLQNLRDANEQLLLSALNVHDLELKADEAQRRQVKFFAMVAHELRNPLNPIRTAAELLDHAGTDAPMLGRLQGIIKRQVAHMTRLIEDLLDGSRLSTGTLRIDRTAVDMGDILGVAIESCRNFIDARHQSLATRLTDRPLHVHGDPVRLAQLFTNLLDNASKYTPDGGKIALEVVAQDGTMTATVSDNGIGISAEALPRIFDLFVQDARARALHKGGLGIGLAVVRELVEAHGGTIVARSAGADLGSQFVVKLPLGEDQVA